MAAGHDHHHHSEPVNPRKLGLTIALILIVLGLLPAVVSHFLAGASTGHETSADTGHE